MKKFSMATAKAALIAGTAVSTAFAGNAGAVMFGGSIQFSPMQLGPVTVLSIEDFSFNVPQPPSVGTPYSSTTTFIKFTRGGTPSQYKGTLTLGFDVDQNANLFLGSFRGSFMDEFTITSDEDLEPPCSPFESPCMFSVNLRYSFLGSSGEREVTPPKIISVTTGVPEPETWGGQIGASLAGLALLLRKRRKKTKNPLPALQRP